MKFITIFITGFCIFMLLPSCAVPRRNIPVPIQEPVLKIQPRARHDEPLKKNLFVLIPDVDGKIGTIAVGNEQGSQVIAQPGLASEVKDAATLPAPPAPMDEKEIKRIFGAALSAQPHLPVTFILYFKTGLTDFAEEFAKSLPSVLATIDARKSMDVIVVGHADRVGTRQNNYTLSLKRAQRVKEILVSRGMDPRAVEIDAHGEDDPLIKTLDEVAEPRNRRAVVTVR